MPPQNNLSKKRVARGKEKALQCAWWELSTWCPLLALTTYCYPYASSYPQLSEAHLSAGPSPEFLGQELHPQLFLKTSPGEVSVRHMPRPHCQHPAPGNQCFSCQWSIPVALTGVPRLLTHLSSHLSSLPATPINVPRTPGRCCPRHKGTKVSQLLPLGLHYSLL
jgi:hypothetical protein